MLKQATGSSLQPFTKEAILGRFLFGKGVSPYAQKYLHTNAGPAFGAVKGNAGGWLRNLAVGDPRAGHILRSRFELGGVAGKGGLFRGSLASSPQFARAWQKLRSGHSSGWSGKNLGRVALGGSGQLLNQGFMLGLPAYGAYNILRGGQPGVDKSEGIGSTLGSGLGFMAGMPLGLVGSIGTSMLGDAAGKAIGKVF